MERCCFIISKSVPAAAVKGETTVPLMCMFDPLTLPRYTSHLLQMKSFFCFVIWFDFSPERLEILCVQWAQCEKLGKLKTVLSVQMVDGFLVPFRFTEPLTYTDMKHDTHTYTQPLSRVGEHNTTADGFCTKAPLSCLHAAFVLHCT